MDLSKIVRASEGGIEIYDMDGQVKSLPDDFFEAYRHIKYLGIYGTELMELPTSFGKLDQLLALRLYKTKMKSLPASIDTLQQIKGLFIRTNSLDINKDSEKIARLPNLEVLELNGYRGNTFPLALSSLKQLKHLKVGSDLKKKATVKEVIAVASQLPQLVKLELDIPLEADDFDESFLQLDRLEKVTGWYSKTLYKPETCPLVIGRLKHVMFERPIDAKLTEFRQITASLNLSNEQLEVLFGIFVTNYTALNKKLQNALRKNIQEGKQTNLVMLDKPKGETAKSIREKLAAHQTTTDGEATGMNDIVVVGAKTEIASVIPYLTANTPIITIDHLKEVLVSQADPWLMQKENETSNVQLLQLLASNQTDNLKVAFQIIEGGGANSTIQALLAAIMLAHPEPTVAKAAEKLYDKYGSQSFKLHAKNSKISLRKSGSTESKVNSIASHPEIESFTFRLMHHAIASANKNIVDVRPEVFRVKDVDNLSPSESLPYFSHFTEMHFENCAGLLLEPAITLMKQMSQLKVLTLSSCKIIVPASIGELTQLINLDLSGNTVESPLNLQSLTSLKVLNLEGTKIEHWEWLTHLVNLISLNISHCALKAIPGEVHSLVNLRHVEAKQNRISQIDERLLDLKSLETLDLSNNQLTVFPYFLCKLPSLKVLLLRSNGIPEFSAEQAKQNAGTSTLSWGQLNLSRNKLSSFSFGNLQLRSLSLLDISNNEIPKLDDSIFSGTSLVELYAEGNCISEIPSSISGRPHFKNLWLHKNKIKRLENFMARITVDNCDLSDNQIEFIHPDFDVYGKDRHARLYWKISKNPISPTLKDFGGLYGWR